jgi:hypothetical protein
VNCRMHRVSVSQSGTQLLQITINQNIGKLRFRISQFDSIRIFQTTILFRFDFSLL